MAFDKDGVTGFLGFSAQGQQVVADTAGFFGFSAGQSTNLIITFMPPVGATTIRQVVTLKLDYAGNSFLITYDPNFPRLEREVPTNTPITLSTTSTYYQPTNDSFSIGTNQVISRIISLDFSAIPYTRILRKHYY